MFAPAQGTGKPATAGHGGAGQGGAEADQSVLREQLSRSIGLDLPVDALDTIYAMALIC